MFCGFGPHKNERSEEKTSYNCSPTTVQECLIPVRARVRPLGNLGSGAGNDGLSDDGCCGGQSLCGKRLLSGNVIRRNHITTRQLSFPHVSEIFCLNYYYEMQY